MRHLLLALIYAITFGTTMAYPQTVELTATKHIAMEGNEGRMRAASETTVKGTFRIAKNDCLTITVTRLSIDVTADDDRLSPDPLTVRAIRRINQARSIDVSARIHRSYIECVIGAVTVKSASWEDAIAKLAPALAEKDQFKLVAIAYGLAKVPLLRLHEKKRKLEVGESVRILFGPVKSDFSFEDTDAPTQALCVSKRGGKCRLLANCTNMYDTGDRVIWNLDLEADAEDLLPTAATAELYCRMVDDHVGDRIDAYEAIRIVPGSEDKHESTAQKGSEMERK